MYAIVIYNFIVTEIKTVNYLLINEYTDNNITYVVSERRERNKEEWRGERGRERKSRDMKIRNTFMRSN
jgi:hypothetical protein